MASTKLDGLAPPPGPSSVTILFWPLALETGLRLSDIVGLDVGIVYDMNCLPYHRFHLRLEIAKGGKPADIFLPDGVLEKLKDYWTYRINLKRPIRFIHPLPPPPSS
jgi:integrase